MADDQHWGPPANATCQADRPKDPTLSVPPVNTMDELIQMCIQQNVPPHLHSFIHMWFDAVYFLKMAEGNVGFIRKTCTQERRTLSDKRALPDQKFAKKKKKKEEKEG